MSDKTFHERYLNAVRIDQKKENNRRLGALLTLWSESRSEYWREAERYYGVRA